MGFFPGEDLAQGFVFKCARNSEAILITWASEVNSLFILKGHRTAVALTALP